MRYKLNKPSNKWWCRVYFTHYFSDIYSARLPDYSKKFTLEKIGQAVAFCDQLDNFLDLGAGNGHYSIPLLHLFKAGTAVEATTNESLNRLSKKYPNLTIYFDYIQNLKLTKKFDFILLADIFEHLPTDQIEKFLKQLSDWQDKNGIIYIMTPNPVFCGPAEQSDLYYTKHKDGHYKHYSKEEVAALFEKYGYQLINYGFEENKLRQAYKWLNFALARRDKKLLADNFLRIISYPIIQIIKMKLKIFSWFVYLNEKKNYANASQAISQTLTFQKII